MGGYVAGKAAMIDALRSTASGFIFTTTLPPALAAGALSSVQHLKASIEERSIMHRNSETVKRRLVEEGFPLIPSISHIVPLLVADTMLCSQVSKMLLDEYDIYIQPINYPTVPLGTERLRITPSPAHTEEDIDHLIESLCSIWDRLGLARAKHQEGLYPYLPKVEFLNLVSASELPESKSNQHM
jgi:5-aminolevulinate synthase